MEETEDQVKRRQLRKVRLEGLVAEAEWQCAFLSVPHAVKGQRIELVWELPQGDLTLAVTLRSNVVRITKVAGPPVEEINNG